MGKFWHHPTTKMFLFNFLQKSGKFLMSSLVPYIVGYQKTKSIVLVFPDITSILISNIQLKAY
jgi:hypothetical protein